MGDPPRIGRRGRRMTDNTPDYFRAAAYADENPSKLKGSFTGSWLLEQIFPLLVYVVDGIIPEGLTLLVAAPKIGKSWLVLGIAIAISTGRRVLGCLPTKSAPVLYLALEDGPRRLQSRLRTLGVTSLSENLTFMTSVPNNDIVGTIQEFMDLHPGKNPVAILDTLGKAKPPAMTGETQYDRDYRVIGQLKALADNNPGSSVIIVHHTRKMDGADFLDAVSGTQGIAGAADTILLLKRSRHETQAQLQVTSRDAAEGEYILEQAGTGNWILAGGSRAEAAKAAAESRNTEGVDSRMADVIGSINRAGKEMTPAQVSADLGSIDGKTAGVYLARAAEANRIRKTSRGKYAPISTVESVEMLNSDLGDFQQDNTFNTAFDEDAA
jgi:hypothetical protein